MGEYVDEDRCDDCSTIFTPRMHRHVVGGYSGRNRRIVCNSCWTGTKDGIPSVRKASFRGEWIAINSPEPSQVNLYDLLDALIERVPWRTEAEMRQYQELVKAHREINLFGYMAEKVSVEKQNMAPKSR